MAKGTSMNRNEMEKEGLGEHQEEGKNTVKMSKYDQLSFSS